MGSGLSRLFKKPIALTKQIVRSRNSSFTRSPVQKASIPKELAKTLVDPFQDSKETDVFAETDYKRHVKLKKDLFVSSAKGFEWLLRDQLFMSFFKNHLETHSMEGVLQLFKDIDALLFTPTENMSYYKMRLQKLHDKHLSNPELQNIVCHASYFESSPRIELPNETSADQRVEVWNALGEAIRNDQADDLQYLIKALRNAVLRSLQMMFPDFTKSDRYRAFAASKYRRRSTYIGAKDLEASVATNPKEFDDKHWTEAQAKYPSNVMRSNSMASSTPKHEAVQRVKDRVRRGSDDSIQTSKEVAFDPKLVKGFDDILMHPAVVKKFKEYLGLLLTDELLLFYLDVEEYRGIPIQKVLQEKILYLIIILMEIIVKNTNGWPMLRMRWLQRYSIHLKMIVGDMMKLVKSLMNLFN